MHPFRTLTSTNGNLEPIDWDSPDEQMMRAEEIEDEPAMQDGMRGIPPDALKRLLMFIIPPESSTQRWAVATKRLVTLAHLAGVEGVAEHSLATLAKQLDCTRAILSIHSLAIVDELGQEQTRGGKKRSSRETYSKSATAAHKRAGHNMTAEP